MLQNLTDVVDSREALALQLQETSTNFGEAGLELFKSARMDGIVVLSSEVAKRYLECNYAYNTHIAPHRLPGVGLSTGDIIQHEGQTYLTIHLNSMLRNNIALHFVREHEGLYVEWSQSYEGMNQRVMELVREVRALCADCFGVRELQEFSGVRSSVGWQQSNTPSPVFLEALNTLAELLIQRRKKGMRPLARSASELVSALAPYSIFQDFMTRLRKEIGHKTFPRIWDNMLQFNAPPSSGGVTMHTYNPSDDVTHAMPSYNDLFIVASQAGNTGVRHFGAGSKPGEHYFMLPPKTPFFSLIQERVDNDEGLKQVWSKSADFGDTLEAKQKKAHEWIRATLPVKGEVIRNVVPRLVGERVLGFHLDMNSEPGNALMRPVVAESHFERERTVVDKYGLRVIRPSFAALWAETPDSYGELPSVFDTDKTGQ